MYFHALQVTTRLEKQLQSDKIDAVSVTGMLILVKG